MHLAKLFQISLRHLERQVKVRFGTTPRIWLKQERLRHALLLLPTAETVKEVAYDLSYPQLSQFCREFKMEFGLTPTAFRRLSHDERQKIFQHAQVASSPVAELV